ncbi:exodeoxyribonuclease VII large subunit [Demequina capsici]|uniref:Exodeoxyribonuclease 7 large subunit n=1 Tax=Demequina capsici TaxID=3075620 RepID=A0AA96JBE8_9MICO|nr:exodeoxyribonuclease VII large subunit [Demequina sp. PMTSA13]WNM27988.1 exodeoxyribonuclease VII large subunit [Demequina sp. PMTSA13]
MLFILRGRLVAVSGADVFPQDNDQTRATLPDTAADTSAERPWPVRHLSPKIGEYIARMSPVWVEGQVLGVKRWRDLVFLTLRDTDENMSLGATLPAAAVEALGVPLEDGARIVIHAKPQWWTKSGALQMRGKEVRTVGLGDLLARIEMLKSALAEEGLFAAERKVPLPFLPRVVGLVCATQGDAEHDVVENAQRRWPAVQFEIRRVTVQGPRAVPEVVAAMRELDARDDVDVIVVARGGGALEDLLAFSDEAMVRAAAAVVTPLVSAIGHEKDSPLLDLVADWRASTPTDAGKRVVPDAAHERREVIRARATMRAAVTTRLDREARGLSSFRTRPVMAHPRRMLDPHRERLAALHLASGRALVDILSTADARTRELAASLRALSPQSTLDRGYAVVRDADGAVVRDAALLDPGDQLLVRVARGTFVASVDDVDLDDQALEPFSAG